MIRTTLVLAAIALAAGTAGAASHMEKEKAASPMPTASGTKAAAKKLGHEVAETGRTIGKTTKEEASAGKEAAKDAGHAVAEGSRKTARKAKAAASAAVNTK